MNWNVFIAIAAVVLVVLLVVALIHRAIRLAIVLALLAVLVPASLTILSGDGADYIARFAGLFAPAIEQKINDGYRDYSEREKENPVLDREATQNALDELWDSAKGKLQSVVGSAP